MTIIIIGGGAAGFFAALSCREHHPDAKILILEKNAHVLSKVKVSGGGRCNLSNAVFNVDELVKNYPRGSKQLPKVFYQFGVQDTIQWFQSRGVPLIQQDDKCIFPEAQDSQVIINCFLQEAKRSDIQIFLQTEVILVMSGQNGFTLQIKNKPEMHADKIIVTTGGQAKLSGFNLLRELGHEIIPPVPSLFTFNMPANSITRCMGIVVDPVTVKIRGTNFKEHGPLLITHWGMSGPAILKLSAWGARHLWDKNYDFSLLLNWTGEDKEESVKKYISESHQQYLTKMVKNTPLYNLPQRLWECLLVRHAIPEEERWSKLSKKNMNKMLNMLYIDEFEVKGKTMFKDEFVTCGGISLKSIDFQTMQSRICAGLYFAGEILDIDGITGGFNLQAAWATGFIAGKLNAGEVSSIFKTPSRSATKG